MPNSHVMIEQVLPTRVVIANGAGVLLAFATILVHMLLEDVSVLVISFAVRALDPIVLFEEKTWKKFGPYYKKIMFKK